MAVIFIPSFTGGKIASSAERKVFDILKNFRMNAFVFHSVGLPRHEKKAYGEVDFIIVCARGVACLEVKGGRVACRNGKWQITDRNGKTVTKNEGPFAQAAGNMFSLRNEIRGRFKDDAVLSQVPVVCGVVFPDIEFMSQTQETIPEIVFDKSTTSVTAYINRIFDYWQSRYRESDIKLDEAQIKALSDWLRGDFCFIPALSERLDRTEDNLVRLTSEQAIVMESLAGNERLLIEGDAGTGKTLLAIDFASKTAGKGKKVLYLTFNKNLANTLFRRAGSPENPDIVNIHALFGRYAGVDSEMVKNHSDIYFSEILPAEFRKHLLALSKEELENMKYDVLVMDEGQDIVKPEYLKSLDILLKGGFSEGCWAIFYDENQNIYNPEYVEGMNELSSFRHAKFKLMVNCRNTVQIGNFCEKASGIRLREFIREIGEEVREVVYDGETSFKNEIEKILKNLETGGVNAGDVVFLSHKRYKNSILSKVGIAVEESCNDDKPGLPKFSTIHSFKGLDSKVVILCDLEEIPEENYQKFVYIAATRARTLLYVTGSRDFFKKIGE